MNRKLYLFIILTFLATSTSFGQGYHIQRHPLSGPYYHKSDSVLFLVSGSAAKNIAVVNPATMDWKYVSPTNYSEYFTHLAIKNSSSAVAIGSSQNILYSTDNLQTFTKVNPVVYANSGLYKTTAGYLAVYKQFSDNWFYFSADGINWTQKLLANTTVPLVAQSGNKVMVHGFGSANYYLSTDGGQTFSFVTNHPASYPTITANEIKMIDENIWYLYSNQGSSKLYRTYDGGGSWDNVSLPSNITDIEFKNKAEGILYDGTNVQTTIDSGKTWTAVSTLPANPGETFSYGGNNIYLGRNYISKDNGSTWQQFLPLFFTNGANNDVYDLDFKGNTGIAVGAAGVFALSFNGGKSFVNQSNAIASTDIMAVKMMDANTIFAGDRNGQVHMSSNQGATWVQKNTNSFTYNAQKFTHSTDGNVIVMTRNGQPVVSDDAGATFEFINVGGGSHAQSVKPNGDFLDVEGVFNYTTFVNDGWRINKINTTNGAKTLVKEIPGPSLNLIDIHMVDDNTGYLFTADNVSKNMAIFKTTNGWSTYSALPEIPPYQSGHVYGKISVFTFGDTIVVAHLDFAGNGKNYYHTSYNGGAGWQVHTINETPFPTLGVHFFNSKRFIYGLDGNVAYINNGGTGTLVAGVTGLTLSTKVNQTVTVFPNPVTDHSIMQLSQEWMNKKINVQIVDSRGMEVLATTVQNNKFSIQEMPQGLYMIFLYEEGEIVGSGKFIKQ